MAIKPAIVDAQLEPIRADHEVTAGIIHKAMFERLLLCDFAIADLTTANANVFYELGVRHAARPHTTLMIFAEQQPMPFDVNLLRALPYKLGAQNSFGDVEAAALRLALSRRLTEVREMAFQKIASDSPLVQLLQGYRCPEVAHLRTDVFREQVDYAESMRRKLADARALKPSAAAEGALAGIEQTLVPFDGVEAGVLVDLFLSYRAVGAFDRMIALYEALPELLKRTVLVREQLAFATNRKAGQKGLDAAERERLRGKAAAVLESIVEERGPNGETCGLLGRIYKDRWDEARGGDPLRARGLLRRAIQEYTRGSRRTGAIRTRASTPSRCSSSKAAPHRWANVTGWCRWCATRSSSACAGASPTTGTTRRCSSSRCWRARTSAPPTTWPTRWPSCGSTGSRRPPRAI